MTTRGERESRVGAGGSRYGGKIKRGKGAGRDGERTGEEKEGEDGGVLKRLKIKYFPLHLLF